MHGRPLDEAKYDASRWTVEPFHLFDCCLENDGVAAMIVVPVECAKNIDHIGHGATGSLADKDEQGQIHNGADDNASGTAVVLHLAEQLSAPKTRRRGIVFALWSGERLGFSVTPRVPGVGVLPCELGTLLSVRRGAMSDGIHKSSDASRVVSLSPPPS